MNTKRKFVKNLKLSSENLKDNKSLFKVTTYNILADCHIKRPDYSYVTDEYLFKRNEEKSCRHQLLMKEIDVILSDIYLWQEIDDFYLPLFKSELKKRGHELVFEQKPYKDGVEGIGISYDESKFKLLETFSFSIFDELIKNVDKKEDIPTSVLDIINEPHVGIICTMQECSSEKIFIIADIHTIYAGYVRPSLTSLQACIVTQNINKIRKKIAAQYSIDENVIPVIFGGDFNSEPDHMPSRLMKQQKLNNMELEELKHLSYELIEGRPVKKVSSEACPLLSYFKDQLCNPLVLKSLYQQVLGEEPIITTADGNNYGTVDFIYASPNVQVHSVLNVDQNIKDVYKHGAPTELFASDHLPLTATLSL